MSCATHHFGVELFDLTTHFKLRLARMMYWVLSGAWPPLRRQPIIIRRRGGFTWALDLSEGIDLAIFLRGRFEPDVQEVLQRLIHGGDSVCDIGANIGAHTLAMGSFVDSKGRVIAFEPTDYAYSKLMRNLSLNPEIEGVVEVHQLALSNRKTAGPPDSFFSSWPLNKPLSQLHPEHGGAGRSASGASVDTLDGFIRARNIDRIDVMKIDVDGYELPVLRGAEGALKKFRPAIVMEVAPSYFPNEDGDSLEDMLEFIDGIGYRMETLKGRGIPLEADFVRDLVPKGTGRNVVLSPS